MDPLRLAAIAVGLFLMLLLAYATGATNQLRGETALAQACSEDSAYVMVYAACFAVDDYGDWDVLDQLAQERGLIAQYP